MSSSYERPNTWLIRTIDNVADDVHLWVWSETRKSVTRVTDEVPVEDCPELILYECGITGQTWEDIHVIDNYWLIHARTARFGQIHEQN